MCSEATWRGYSASPEGVSDERITASGEIENVERADQMHEKEETVLRLTRSGLCLLLVGLLLTASTAVIQASTVTHLTYVGHGQAWMDFLNDRVEAFKAIEPDITIEIAAVAGSEYRDQMTVMVASGSAPDVTDFYPALAGDFIPQGYFLDLAPYVRRATGSDATAFFAGPVIDAVSFDGKLWSLPVYLNPRVTYYNADLFGEAGLANPGELGEDWTWDALRESARRITRDLSGDGENDRFGIENLAYYMSWQQFIHGAGGRLYDRIVSPTESRFNTEPVRQGVEFARRLLVDDNVVGGVFAQGNVGVTTHQGPALISNLTDPGFGWDLALQPRGPESSSAAFGIGGFQIASGSDNPEAAWKWLQFLTLEPESARAYVRTNGRIPTLQAVQPEYQELVPALPNNWMALTQTVEQPNSFTLYVLTKNSGEVNSVVNGTLGEVWAGETATDIALERIHEQVNALLQE